METCNKNLELLENICNNWIFNFIFLFCNVSDIFVREPLDTKSIPSKSGWTRSAILRWKLKYQLTCRLQLQIWLIETSSFKTSATGKETSVLGTPLSSRYKEVRFSLKKLSAHKSLPEGQHFQNAISCHVNCFTTAVTCGPPVTSPTILKWVKWRSGTKGWTTGILFPTVEGKILGKTGTPEIPEGR